LAKIEQEVKEMKEAIAKLDDKIGQVLSSADYE